MSMFHELQGMHKVASVCTETTFQELLKESLDAILNESASASDADLQLSVQSELGKLSVKYKRYALQDNVYALKKKLAIEQVMQVLSKLTTSF